LTSFEIPTQIPGVIATFLGKDSENSNPGAPSLDPDFEEKSKKLALRFCQKNDNSIIISPNSDHSRTIPTILDPNKLYLGDRCRIATSVQDDWLGTSIFMNEIPEGFVIPIPGDGIVVRSPCPRRIVLQLRTRDCTPIIGWNKKNGLFFVAHLSAETLFGWTSAKNNRYQLFRDIGGSMLHQLFKLVDPTESTVFVGPSISGIQSGCWCYEYTETLGNPDGSMLMAGIAEEYPGLNTEAFYKMRPEDGKMDIHWGNLVLEVLKQHRVAHIDTRYNYCTQCNPERFYSHRAYSKSPDPLNQELLRKKIGNIAMLVILAG